MCVCDHMCAHKHVYTFTCAYLIISQVSRNIYSVILLRSTQGKEGSFLCSFPEMLHRFFPYGVVYLGALGRPVLTLQLQNFTALSGHFGNFESLPSTSMFFTVSAHLVSGDLFILFVHTWWLQCTSYK